MIRSKYFFLVTFLLLFSYLNSYSNGVGVVNASTGIYLKLTGTSISASVEMQVSVTKSQQLFYNNLGSDKTVAYAFPLPEGASATELKWRLNGEWHIAPISEELSRSKTIVFLNSGTGKTGFASDSSGNICTAPEI